MKKRYVLVFVSFLVLAALFAYSKPEKVFAALSASDKIMLLYAFIVSSAAALLRVLKWNVLLRGVSFFDVMPVQLLGSTISNFTPAKIGEPAKLLLLKMRTGINVSRSLTSVIWERIADILVLVLFAALFFRSEQFFYLEIAGMIVFAGAVSFFLLLVYRKDFGLLFFRFLRKLPFSGRVSEQFIETFYAEKIAGKNIAAALFATILAWVADGIVFYLCFRSLGIELNPVFLIGLLCVSTIVGIASFLPGGLGSTDSVMVLVLAAAMDASTAFTGVLLGRMLTFWFSAFLGFLSFAYLSRSMDMKRILE